MATIFNNIDKVGGAAQAGVLVTIDLLWDTSASPVARISDEDTLVHGSFGTTTDEDGAWEQDVVPNDSILPADSVYKITERLSTSETGLTYYVSVPDNATPTFWVGDILTDTPEWV